MKKNTLQIAKIISLSLACVWGSPSHSVKYTLSAEPSNKSPEDVKITATPKEVFPWDEHVQAQQLAVTPEKAVPLLYQEGGIGVNFAKFQNVKLDAALGYIDNAGYSRGWCTAAGSNWYANDGTYEWYLRTTDEKDIFLIQNRAGNFLSSRYQDGNQDALLLNRINAPLERWRLHEVADYTYAFEHVFQNSNSNFVGSGQYLCGYIYQGAGWGVGTEMQALTNIAHPDNTQAHWKIKLDIAKRVEITNEKPIEGKRVIVQDLIPSRL